MRSNRIFNAIVLNILNRSTNLIYKKKLNYKSTLLKIERKDELIIN